MPTWLALVLLLSAVATVYLMVIGIGALRSRRLQLIGGGRTLVGPLAQLCGLLSLAPLLLCLISAGELSYRLDVRQRPEPPLGTSKASGEDVDGWQQKRAEGKQLLLGMAGDFGLFGIPFDLLVGALVATRGIRPPRKHRLGVVAFNKPQWRDPDFL
jgi:hypothetical protein